MMRKLSFLLAMLWLASPFVCTAQLEGGLTFGLASHQGDLHCRTDDNIKLFDETNPAFGLLLRYKFNELLALRGQFTYLSLTGNEANFSNIGHNSRGYSFRNDMLEAAGMLELDLLGKRRYQDGAFRQVLSPYIFAGVGADFTSPNVDFNGNANNANIRIDQAAKKVLLAVPVGLGLRYNLSEQVGIGVEGGLRLPVSDYYDGVSKAANPEFNDLYAIGNAFMTVRFGKMDKDEDGVADDVDKCPEIPGLVALQGCPDADADGITDSDDKCPNSAGIAVFGGCPDSDADGVPDSDDDCPNTAGLATFKGCPDTDKDGITDADDECPNMAGSIATKGCPDSDNDGVQDAEDICPTIAGTIATKGCPDADLDGIADMEDSCPKLAGIAELKGCPADDADKDGVKDADDRCPNIAGLASNNGCPETTTTTSSSGSTTTGSTTTGNTSIGSSIAPENMTFENIYFGSNKAGLNANDKATLDGIVGLMQTNPNYHLDLGGYTDSDGRAAANEALSERRAKICRDYLIQKGIAADRISTFGLGERNPAADNATAAGKAQNRRVELKLRDRSTGSSFGLIERGIGNGISAGSAADCGCEGLNHPVFQLPTNRTPKTLRRLGTNPEFGDSHALDGAGFYNKLKTRYAASRIDATFLDAVFMDMGYSGFADADASMFSETTLPYGIVGNLGYSKNHKTLYAKLNNSNRDLRAFRIRAANGCDLHFMKTCGNHMFFCTK